jgi:hypothetical protein
MSEKIFYKLFIFLNTIVCMFGMPRSDNQLLANDTNQTGQHVNRALFNGKLTRYMILSLSDNTILIKLQLILNKNKKD